MTEEMVIAMEGLIDPMPVWFLFKVTNVGAATLYIKSLLLSPPTGWVGATESHGAIAVGLDKYFCNDNNTRTKPTNLTTEAITLEIEYYSDAGYTNLVNIETVSYDVTFVDFTDATFTVVDDDTFEIDLEGWTKVDEIGASSLTKSTVRARTGVASMLASNILSGNVAYAHKSFVMPAGTGGFIRLWIQFDASLGNNVSQIFELITDPTGTPHTITVASSGVQVGGSSTLGLWLCLAAKMAVGTTVEVRLRHRPQVGHASNPTYNAYYDDIRVIKY